MSQKEKTYPRVLASRLSKRCLTRCCHVAWRECRPESAAGGARARHAGPTAACSSPRWRGHWYPEDRRSYAPATLSAAHTRDSSSSCRQTQPHLFSPHPPRLCCPPCHRHVQSRHHRAPGEAPQAHERAQCRRIQYGAPVVYIYTTNTHSGPFGRQPPERVHCAL